MSNADTNQYFSNDAQNAAPHDCLFNRDTRTINTILSTGAWRLTLYRSSKGTHMKLACFNDTHLGVVTADERIIDVTDLAEPLPGHTLQQIVEKVLSSWGQMQPIFEAALKNRVGVPIQTVALLSPIPEPSKILWHGSPFG